MSNSPDNSNTEETREEQKKTSMKRKRDDVQETDRSRSRSRHWIVVHVPTHITLSDIELAFSAINSNQRDSFQSNTIASIIVVCDSCSHSPPAKRARYATSPKPILKSKPIKKTKQVTVKRAKVTKTKTQDEKVKSATKEVDVCPICQQGYRKGVVKKFLPCAHYFHKNCVNKWLKANNTCPVCRTDPSAPTGPTSTTFPTNDEV